VKDHDHVPAALVPDFATVPIEAESVTPLVVVSLSDQLPVLLAFWASFTVTLALFTAICAGTFPTTVNAFCKVSVDPPGRGLVTETFRVLS
jgi:hypothetical protein